MHTKYWFVLLLLIGVIVIPINRAHASEPATDINFDDYAVEMIDYTLPNGLRVILAEDHSAPVVTIDTWYHVGSANDPQNYSGFAHLFEHLMFRGSENVEDGEYDLWLEAVGAENSAYTTYDRTAYWVKAPAHELPRVLWLESDRLASLQITQDVFEAERDVVIQEFNQNVANSPYGVSFERLYSLPLQGYPPYERTVIGSPEDLERATLKEVQTFFDAYYNPSNATLIIVGDIDIPTTQALVNAYFADIPAGDPVASVVEQYPVPDDFPIIDTDSNGCQIGAIETLIDPLIDLPLFTAAVVGPSRGTADFYALDLLTRILGDGESSRFAQNVTNQGLVTDAGVFTEHILGLSLFAGYVFPNEDETPEEAQELFLAELQKVIDEGVTEAELERAKQKYRVDTITWFRASSLDTAEMLNEAAFYFDDPAVLADELAQVDAVTVDDLQRVAQTYFCDKPMNFTYTLSEGDESLADYPGVLVEAVNVTPTLREPSVITATELVELPAGVVNRVAVPDALPLSDVSLPTYETFTLDNGLDVIFVEQHELPELQLKLYLGGANAAATAQQQGVGNLAAELLTKGTPTRSADEIAEAIESGGGYLSAKTRTEWLDLTAYALKTDTNLAFDLLSDAAQNATFPQEEFDISQEQILAWLDVAETEPDTLADRHFDRVLFGDHPYGYTIETDKFADLIRSDVVKLSQTYFKPNNALLAIVGDITADEAISQTERVFADWQSDDVPDFRDYPPATTGDTSVIYLIDRPGSEQSTLRVGSLAIAASNPDRYALDVVNTALGDSFYSRLNNNLRADKGYTYGAYSGVDQLSDVGAFRVETSVEQDYTGDALQEILNELETIRTEPIPAEELADTKGQIIGGLALEIEDPLNFTNTLARYHLTDVPDVDLDIYITEIQQVTAADALDVAQTYFDADKLVIVVVGDAEIVESQLAE